MTDKRIKMDCPFCGCDKSNIQVIVAWENNNGKYCEVRCPDCNVKFTGYGKQNMIDKWNCRV